MRVIQSWPPLGGDEEGWRFGRGLFGSRAMCGRLEPSEESDSDAEGVTLADAVAALGR